MQKELGSPLIKYLKNEADKRMIGEQIENKLELLILEEIKKDKKWLKKLCDRYLGLFNR